MRAAPWTVLRLRDGARPATGTLRRVRPEATVAELAASLGHDPATGLVVDGRTARPGDRLDEAGVCQGSLIEPGPGPLAATNGLAATADPVVAIVVADGADAGRRVVLGPGHHLIGRSAACAVALDDDGIDPLHATIEVDASGGVAVTALGEGTIARSRSGPGPLRPGEWVTIGPRMLVLEPIRPVDRVGGVDPVLDRTARATLVLNRPPLLRTGSTASPVGLPRPPLVPAAPALPVATIVVPLVVAVALVTITRNWLYAGLTALTPVLAGTSWWSARRSVRRSRRTAEHERTAALDRLAQDLRTARDRDDATRTATAVRLAEAARWIRTPTGALWSRRPGDPDAFTATLGTAEQVWTPAADVAPWYRTGDVEPDVVDLCERIGAARRRPVVVDLAARRVLGIVGPLGTARSVARSVVLQLVAQHGPADLRTLVVADAGAEADWSWSDWLPHRAGDGADQSPGTATGDSGQSAGRPDARAVAAGLLEQAAPDGARPKGRTPPPSTLLVVDDASVLGRPDDPVRRLLRGDAGPVLAVVVAAAADRLPASCRAVLEIGPGGLGCLRTAPDGALVEHVAVDGAALSTSTDLAATLARYEDPELERPGATLPAAVGLLELLRETAVLAPHGPADGDLATAVGERWHRTAGDPGTRLAVPIGIGLGPGGAPGAVTVDLLRDGPHALVAGTTGAGKSELLRTWVAGLAASCPPDGLHLVLVDFKGGSAFDAAAALPHTVAVVSDLDDALAERALRALHAELRRREQVLRDAAVPGIDELWAVTPPGRSPALARLVVVVDEFAGLAAELPGFLDSLVGVAQRGRSLGVHLVLATQRPAGVVSDQIRANTNIRIALRVQDHHDGLDVVGVADPADLDRRQAGRAYLRLGRGDVRPVQTAFAGTVEPVRPPAPVEAIEPEPRTGRTDLDRVVVACRLAAESLGIAPPRSPWPPPLPDRLDAADLTRLAHGGSEPDMTGGPDRPDASTLVPFLLIDDPDEQCRRIGGWTPHDGNLAVIGCRGSGATGTLVSALGAAFVRWEPDDLHAYVIGDDPALGALGSDPHVGAVVRTTDTERRARLLARLDAELAARRDHPDPDRPPPRLIVAIDGIGSLRAALDGSAPGGDAERLERLVSEGPAHRMWCIVAAEHPAALPHRMAAAFTQRLVLRLADPLDARLLGTQPVHGPPGRGRLATSGHLVQVVDPRTARRAPARRPAPAVRPPWPVPTLPERIDASALVDRPLVQDATGALVVAVGVGGLEVVPTGLTLRPGEGVLVAGPARSGRSTVLAHLAGRLVDRATIVAVAPRPSPLDGIADVEPLRSGTLTPDLLDVGTPAGPTRVLLVDDADTVTDPVDVVGTALATGWIVMAAGRSDALRSAFGHWTRAVRAGRTGVLLRPDVDLDGDLLGVRLPRRSEAPLDRPGRGFLVDVGEVTLVQCAGV